MKIYLNFGGFYYSEHSNIIENVENQIMEDDNSNLPEDYNYNANYSDLKNEYCKKYIEFINETLNINLKYISLSSPKYYNYTTDQIEANITQKDIKTIYKFIKDNNLTDDVIERIKHITTSRDGYIPYYDFNEVNKKENIDIFIECIFDVLFIEDVLLFDNWYNWYDLNCVFDDLYNIFKSNYDGNYELKYNDKNLLLWTLE